MVAIRGMEMPENCSDCDFESYPRGTHYCQLVMRAIESLGRPDWCPLVEVEDLHSNPEDSIRDGAVRQSKYDVLVEKLDSAEALMSALLSELKLASLNVITVDPAEDIKPEIIDAFRRVKL